MTLTRKTFIPLLALLLLAAASCSRDNSADLSEIFSTVPSDAGMVAAFDASVLADKAGLKTSDGQITDPGMLPAVIKGLKEEVFRLFMAADPESGADLTAMALFAAGSRFYLTGLLRDPQKFMEYASRRHGGQFAEKDGIRSLGPYACHSNRFWITIKGDIDPADVKEFIGLSENKSFLSVDYSEKLLEMKHDIGLFADINSELLTPGDFAAKAKVSMALNTLFNDATYLGGGIDFLKGEMKGALVLLDTKMRPAEFNFPVSKISAAAVESLGSGNSAVAMALSRKFVEAIEKATAGTGLLGKTIASVCGPLDGTSAFMMGGSAGSPQVSEGVVQTTGNDLGGLTAMLESAGLRWRLAGKELRIEGTPAAGSISGKEFAKYSKGAFMALATDLKAAGTEMHGLKTLRLKLAPDGKGLRIEVGATAGDPSRNILTAIMENAGERSANAR